MKTPFFLVGDEKNVKLTRMEKFLSRISKKVKESEIFCVYMNERVIWQTVKVQFL